MGWKCVAVEVVGTTTAEQNLIKEEIEKRLNFDTVSIIQSSTLCLLV
jgi:hypothetical protein